VYVAEESGGEQRLHLHVAWSLALDTHLKILRFGIIDEQRATPTAPGLANHARADCFEPWRIVFFVRAYGGITDLRFAVTTAATHYFVAARHHVLFVIATDMRVCVCLAVTSVATLNWKELIFYFVQTSDDPARSGPISLSVKRCIITKSSNSASRHASPIFRTAT
jgi:hypothetical protein